MSEWHPDRAVLEKFLDGRFPEEASWALQRHLVTCPSCEARMTRLLERQEGSPAPGAKGSDDDGRSLVRRFLTEMRPRWESVAQERWEARRLWDALRDRSFEEWRHAMTQPSSRTRALCELILEETRHTVLVEPRRAEQELHLALEIAEGLDVDLYGPGAVAAVQARAWAWLGNCLRVLSDFRQAEQAFRMAELYLTQSWLDPLDEGLILELKGSLRRGQRRFEESVRLYDEALAVYRQIGETHLQGRVLMIKGLTLQYKGDLSEAAVCYRHSLDLLDGREEPRLVVASQCNLVFCLLESGRAQEAASHIPEARRQLERAGTRSDLLRLRWVEGRAFSALGRAAEAEEAFLEVKQAFLADGIPFDVALASLDLAALYARHGRTADVKRLAEEILPIFRSCEVPQEALAALIVFQKAAEREQLTLGLVEEVSTVLRRVQPPQHPKPRLS